MEYYSVKAAVSPLEDPYFQKALALFFATLGLLKETFISTTVFTAPPNFSESDQAITANLVN